MQVRSTSVEYSSKAEVEAKIEFFLNLMFYLSKMIIQIF